jgi:hypothetical protein
MGGQVAVTELEPVGLHAVLREFFLGVPGFATMAPAAFRVDAATQGVHAGVQVGADPHPVHPRVVADVDDRGQLVFTDGRRRRGELAQSKELLYPEQEAGAANPADQNRDLHTARQYARPQWRRRGEWPNRSVGLVPECLV